MTCRNKDAVSSSLFRKPAIAGQGCTYCADASEPEEAKCLGSCCSFLQAQCADTGTGQPTLQMGRSTHAGCRKGHLFARSVYNVLLDRNKEILHVGRGLLCRISREKQILCVSRGPPYGAAWKSRACTLIANHSSLQYIQLFCTVEIGYYL